VPGPNEVKITITGDDKSKSAFSQVDKAADNLEEYLKKAGKTAKKSFDEIGDGAKSASKQLEGMHGAAEQASKSIEKVGDKGKRAGDDVKGALGDSAKGAAEGLAGRLGPLGDMFGKLGPAALIAGAAIGAGLGVAAAAAKGLEAALKASIDRAHVGALIGAQGGGIDPKRIAQLGKLAGKVYADNFGESLEQAGTAVRDVLRNHLLPESATDEAVKKTTEKLLTISTVIDAETSEVARSVKQLIQTGMVQTADQAFDLIAKGAQAGLNVADDLLDTFNEYSTQFRKLGIDGTEALGLIQQGLKGGARDADIVADALKEFSIRAVDGSKTTADGFKRLGLDGKKMAEDIAAGGERANGALDKTLDRLRNIKDPVERAQVAVELFGTQAEDLGAALYSLDPSNAVQALGKVQGAADDASKALGGGLGNQFETFKRQAQQLLADVGDEIAPYAQKFVDTYKEFGGEVKGIFADSTVPQELKDSLRDVAEKYGPKLKEVLGDIADKIRENKPELEELGHILAEKVIPFLGDVLVHGLELAGDAISTSIEIVGHLTRAWMRFKDDAGEALIEFKIVAAEAFLAVAEVAADAFSWLPGLGPKLAEGRDKIKKFVDQANAELDRLHDKDIYIAFHAVGDAAALAVGAFGKRTGGPTSTAATGGPRDGLVQVGEEGPEFVRLPTGSMVYPQANRNQMAAQSNSAGAGAQMIELRVTGSGALYELLMAAMRNGELQVPGSAIT